MTQQAVFDVITPGVLTTLQDQGRWGQQRMGVSPCGAMDIYAAAWANRLLDNPGDAPLLEILQGGVILTALETVWVAVAGAQVALTIRSPAGHTQRTPESWSRFMLKPGQQLCIGYARQGLWSYLAVSGGFVAPLQLGSVATQLREGLGGLNGNGKPLACGDRLLRQVVDMPFKTSALTPSVYRPAFDTDVLPLRFTPAHDYRRFDSTDLQRFIDTTWHLSTLCNRMGYRMTGDSPLQSPPERRWSLGVLPGAIQIVPEGYPIVLMADGQTMGGYPLLGWVHPLDRAQLAQRTAQQRVRFTLSTVQQLQQELIEQARIFRSTRLR